MTRRDWLRTSGAAIAGAALEWWWQWPSRQAAPSPTFAADVELWLTARPDEIAILPGAATEVWRFAGRVVSGPPDALDSHRGSYLGPTIRLRRGQRVRITFENQLPDPSIVHWHGLDVPQEADGHPRFAVPSGARYVYEFTVRNRAGTYWYHPHPHMQTGPQVQRGLAGLLIVADDEESALGLPAGPEDLTWVIQDRRFDQNNQIVYGLTMMDMETGWLGNMVLVNGQPQPAFALGSRAYRIRVLNGSNARVYKLAWSDSTPMTVIGVDGGLIDRPRDLPFVTLAPAQRVDLWLDLSRRPVGARLELRSGAFPVADAGLSMGGMQMPMGRGRGFGRGAAASPALPLGAPLTLLSIDVSRRENVATRLPTLLSRAITPEIGDGVPVRRVPLTFAAMAWMIDGRRFEMAGVSAAETVARGSTQIWEFVNTSGPMGMQMAHPMHVHGKQFQVVSRTGGDPGNALRPGIVDAGWLDTVLVLPGETVRVRLDFSDFPGLFLYHCHILEHEDMGMMRNFRIV